MLISACFLENESTEQVTFDSNGIYENTDYRIR